MSNATTKRLAMAAITATVQDFVNSGYLAMLSASNPVRQFVVSKDLQLHVSYTTRDGKEVYSLGLINGKTGLREQVTYTLKRGSLGVIAVTEPELSQPPIQWIALTGRLLVAINTLYQRTDALGNIRTYEGRGNGFSPTEGEFANSREIRKNNAALGGSSGE